MQKYCVLCDFAPLLPYIFLLEIKLNLMLLECFLDKGGFKVIQLIVHIYSTLVCFVEQSQGL